MKPQVQTRRDYSLSDVAYEPYKGFLQGCGFHRDKRFPFLRDAQITDNYLLLSDSRYEDSERFVISFNPRIQLSRMFLYEIQNADTALKVRNWTINSDGSQVQQILSLAEIVELEQMGIRPTAALTEKFAQLKEAGVQSWRGYHILIETSNSSHQIVVKDDFAEIGKKGPALADFALESAKRIYSRLNAFRVNYADLRLNIDYWLLERDVKKGHQQLMQHWPGPGHILPQEELEREQIVQSLLFKYAPKIEERLDNAGITDCDQKFVDWLWSYCRENSLPVVQAETGRLGRSSVYRWGFLRSALRSEFFVRQNNL